MAAGYARLEYGRPEGLRLYPEVRGTLYGWNGRLEPKIEPRLTARYPLSSSFEAKASAGYYTQLPEERQYASFGNPALEVMTAVQGSAGIEASLPWQVSLESTVFASRLRDLTLRRVDSEIIFNGYDYSMEQREVFYTADGWGYGGEVTLKRPLGDFTGSLSYAYTRSLRETVDGVLPGDYDQPHTLTALGAWSLPKRWVVSGRFRVGSGQPYTPQYGVWRPDYGFYAPVDGQPNSARFRTFHQLDLRLDKTYLKDWWKLNFYLDIQNVYLARNPIYQEPSWNYRGEGSYIWLPIIPTLGFKGEF